MKKTTKIVLVGVSIASTVAAGIINSNATKQTAKNLELTRRLKESANNYEKLILENKKLSKRVITEINRILTLSDSIKNLDKTIKKNKLDLLALSDKILLSEQRNSKNSALASRNNLLDNKFAKEILETKNKILEVKQSITEPIYIANIETTPMKKRTRGGFTETANYKKIDGFRTQFQIANNEVSDSSKKVSLKLLNTEEKTLNFTNELELNFNQKFLTVDTLIEVERKKITSGDYKLIVSVDNKIIKSSNITIE